MTKKVVIALSGGVDSGVAAALLVEKRYEVMGFHMRLWSEEVKYLLPREKAILGKIENKCCSEEAQVAAEKTAEKLGIPFELVNLSYQFKKGVVDYFLEAYIKGLTPNPCVMCNKLIKFGELYDYARARGFDFLSTGHYARIINGRLYEAKDKKKDQTYFLYNLTAEQLKHVLFPIGDYTKKEVKEMAEKRALPVAQRPESQEICFLPEADYRPFLKRHAAKIKPGEVVNTKGEIIGTHEGLPLYTIGQRHGFMIKTGIGPFYVIDKDIKKNRLIVGFGKETEKDQFLIGQTNWISIKKEEVFGKRLEVKIRHLGAFLPARLEQSKEKKKLLVKLAVPERGIAPGQAAVFYKGDEVLGGGTIY